jgi:Cys-tRNA(Pro)/Cys-tRNA(Cys) deacylase
MAGSIIDLKNHVREKMAKTTPATKELTKAGVAFELLAYDYESGAGHIGLHAAEAVGEPPSRVLKTLMLHADGKPACAVIPSDRELSMKKIAATFGAKSAELMKPADAERLTGYHIGGISPFGQRKKVRTAIEAAALAEPYVLINGGGRGLMVRLAPADAVKVLGATTADVMV